ncbi:MAG: tRNA dihydrouridine synthase DusB [Rhodobacterales bacterium]
MSSVLIENKALAPAVFLAPLAGITDLPFRNLVSGFGAGLVVSEMVASQDMVQARPSMRARAELGFGAENTAVQIAGREAYWMAECAKLCAGNGAKIIDINMGCPSKTVTHGQSGSALMKTPDFALSLIEAVVNAVDVPVTLKTRLGWDDTMLNAPQIAKSAEAAGVQMVTIHGRTRCQLYKGKSDWAAIARVKNALDIPVIANGDIVDSASAKCALEQSGADGVMVGRGAQGRPWILAEIAHDIYGYAPPKIPYGYKLIEVISTHYEAMLSFYGAELGTKVARKHLGWYMDGLGTPKSLRQAIFTEKNPKLVLSLIARLNDVRGLAA